MRLETLHKQAVTKAKELDRRIEMDILAQSQQRGNLIQMVDDLTKQLQEQKEKFVDKGVLFTEKHAH